VARFLKESGYKILPIRLLNGEIIGNNLNPDSHGSEVYICYLTSKGTRSRISKINLIGESAKDMPNDFNPIDQVLPVATNDYMNQGLLGKLSDMFFGEFKLPIRLIIHRVFDVKCPYLRQGDLGEEKKPGKLGDGYCGDENPYKETGDSFIKSYNDYEIIFKKFFKEKENVIDMGFDIKDFCQIQCKQHEFNYNGYELMAAIEGCILACRNMGLQPHKLDVMERIKRIMMDKQSKSINSEILS